MLVCCSDLFFDIVTRAVNCGMFKIWMIRRYERIDKFWTVTIQDSVVVGLDWCGAIEWSERVSSSCRLDPACHAPGFFLLDRDSSCYYSYSDSREQRRIVADRVWIGLRMRGFEPGSAFGDRDGSPGDH